MDSEDLKQGSRPMRTLFAFVVVALASTLAVAADWHMIQPHVTTESELLSVFGPPDEVVSTYPWSEWSAKWKKRPNASHYTLMYRGASGSALLVGPAGKADSVEVAISNSKVIGLTWHHGGPSAKAAAASLRADPEMAFGPNKTVFTAGKGSPGQSIYVEFGPDDSEVAVHLSLK